MKREKEQPLYMISVVARMLRVHPQTLRMYEREGFVHPTRTGRQRLYSEEDVDRLGLVIRLTREMGVNKAGVDIILRMRERIERLQHEMFSMMEHMEEDFRDDFERRVRRMFGAMAGDDQERQ